MLLRRICAHTSCVSFAGHEVRTARSPPGHAARRCRGGSAKQGTDGYNGVRVRAWARRTFELRGELAAIAEVDPRWWLLAGGVALAEPWAPPEVYLACDAEPDADTLMGYRAPRPKDPVADAIRRAKAARTALRELDGQLPEQPLAVTIDRACAAPPASALAVAAFAYADRCLIAELDDPSLPARLAAMLEGGEPRPWFGATPFVCVSIGDEAFETARHGHRRAWTSRGGPWLGLGRAGDVCVVSTCHLIVDGWGHARITARIAELTALGPGETSSNGHSSTRLAPVAGAVPLAIAWRELPCPTPRAIPLAYRLGCLLHRNAGQRAARFSPTFQLPVARGHKDDPLRLRRRVVAATMSVRFDGGAPEPYEVFEARARGIIAREAGASGLVSRLLAAAREVPVPLAWKLKSISAKRPPWLEGLAEVIGGRALLSRIVMDVAMPATCAVSSPSRMATPDDPVGGCVITILEGHGDGHGHGGHGHGAITACGSGYAGTEAAASGLLDELLDEGAVSARSSRSGAWR